MRNKISAVQWVPFVLFFVAFVSLPIVRLDYLAAMPGNIGDARLNNYFLENIYLYFSGRSDSLWQLGFFYPFPYVLGFSDSLFGSAPVYALMRLISGQPDTAYQLWFLFAYGANFAAGYYALRRLGGSRVAASVGALIFAFALPTTAHAGHAQLHYRFGLPLAIVFFAQFLDRKEWRYLVVCGAWTVWQLYCGVYIGFFTLLFLAALVLANFAFNWIESKTSPWKTVTEFSSQWSSQSRVEKIKILSGLALLFGLLVLLFYPYLQVSRLYGATRSWDEIKTMLPRPQSYFLSDASRLWSAPDSKIFASIPMRHEQQMFVGVVPLLLATLGFFVGNRAKNGRVFALILGMLGIVVGLTTYIAGFSIWYLFHKFPLASAIRAMSRIDLAILFPIAYFSVIAIDWIKGRARFAGGVGCLVLVSFMVFEFSATTMDVSLKEYWRARLADTASRMDKQIPKDSVVFFTQDKGPYYADELDAMWVALSGGIKTLNGYSGLLPAGYSLEYGNDCAELPKRIFAYLAFKGQTGNENAYRELMKRIVPIGFDGCVKDWRTTPPRITASPRAYTADELRQLRYIFGEKRKFGDKNFVEIKILNSGGIPISALSGTANPVRISWRFLDASGTPVTNFETRKDLPFDIPSHGDISVQIPIDPKMEVKGGALQVSLVQEGMFWAHDIGIAPISIPWK